MLVCWANERLKQVGWVGVTIPPLCPLSLHILFSAWLLFPLFLPQDTVNALSDFLQIKIRKQKEFFNVIGWLSH